MVQGIHIVNGAVHGNGTYLAEEPHMSVGYARFMTDRWANSVFGIDADYSVLLACELAGVGDTAGPNGFWIVKRDELIMVRYVFLLPRGWTAPERRHVEDAFMAAFRRLRVPDTAV
jgi:hypothetical protein